MTAQAKNPFQPAAGARPPILVGREAELASMSDAVARLSSGSPPVVIAILGLRGLGKTALLSELESRLAPSRTTVLRLEVERNASLASVIRAKISRSQRDGESIPKKLAKALEQALEHFPTVTYELPGHAGSIGVGASADRPDTTPDSGPLAELIGVYNETLHAQHRTLAILIDEIQDIDVPTIGSIAAAVHQSAATDTPILLAVAGLPQAEALFKRIRTYTQRWDHLSLDFLTRAEIGDAVRIPIAKAGATIDDAAVDRLTEECAGYPYFVQLFASTAWNEHTGSNVTLDDVERSIPPVRARIEKTFYRDVLDDLTIRELTFAIALADLGPGPQRLGDVAAALGVPSERLGSIRANLIKKDVILSPGPRLLEFRIPLLDRYVREHRPELHEEAVKSYRKDLTDA